MKNSILLLACAVFAVGLTTSCQKEEGMRMSKITFSATAENGGAKATVSEYDVLWETNDEIEISNGERHSTYYAQSGGSATTTFACQEGEDVTGNMFYAVYPKSAFVGSGSVRLAAEQDGTGAGPMYAVSNSHTLIFSHLTAMLRLHLEKSNTSVKSIIITTDKQVSGTFDISNAEDGGYQVAAGSDATSSNNSITITPPTAIDISNGGDVLVALPAGTYHTLDITIVESGSKQCTKRLDEEDGFTFERNILYPITFGESTLTFALPEGAIDALFSVSATKQVYFSKGNLRYTTSTSGSVWEFASPQKSYYTSFSNKKWELFSWSTTSDNFGMSTNSRDAYYSGDFQDWGVNPISNGGNKPNMWRTLSQQEWDYLIKRKSGGETLCYTVKFNGTEGLMLLPDNFTWPGGMSAPNRESAYAPNYSNAQVNELEQAGVVFLPAAGIRDGSAITRIENGWIRGTYWSSTQTSTFNASALFFVDDNSGGRVTSYSRKSGRCVRLVLK